MSGKLWRLLPMFSFTKKLSVIVSFVTVLSGQFSAFASDEVTDLNGGSGSAKLPSNVQETMQTPHGPVHEKNKIQIFTLAAMDEKTDPGNLRLVCREWRGIIDRLINKENKDRKYVDQHPIWQKIMRVFYAGLGHDAEWKRILNGELIYLTDPYIKLGKVSDLNNPFSDAFDISKCDKVSKRVHLRMGLCKGKRDENKGMAEICFTPRLMAVHQLKGDESYLKEIMGQWPESNAVAIISSSSMWHNGSLVDCVFADFEKLSIRDLVYTHCDVKIRDYMTRDTPSFIFRF